MKLSNLKIQWLIQEKRKGRGSGELALIQKLTRRRVEQLWQAYRLTEQCPPSRTQAVPEETET